MDNSVGAHAGRLQESMMAVFFAAGLTFAVVTLGYHMLGWLPAALFALGYVGGLLVWLWRSTRVSFRTIRVPYLVTLAPFVVHKYEERTTDFFPALSGITGIPAPETTDPLVYVLYALASAWLLAPWLIWRGSEFGYFLAWSFFLSMGVTELAHFLLPLLKKESYGYFPGMWSVIPLAPAAWWGVSRLWTGRGARWRLSAS